MCKMCRLLVILLCLVFLIHSSSTVFGTYPSSDFKCWALSVPDEEYEFKCPYSGEWQKRAAGFNCSINNQYVCLFKYPERTYHETCDGLDYSSIGSKLIFEPFFNKAYCSYERYQPFPFSTDGSSTCVYQKSVCTEKGQYLFQKGNQRSDITCGCDLAKGYEFVTKPKHDCYCVPSEDDCSCHKLPCHDLVDNCPQDGDEILTKSIFITLKENSFKDRINIFDEKDNGKTYRFQCLYISSVLLAVMIIVVIFVYMFAGFKHEQQQDRHRINKLRFQVTTEKRYFVRVMIVGKESTGKTCLLKRLLKEDISNVTSTDGVDTVVRRCKINIADGSWIIGKGRENFVFTRNRCLVSVSKDKVNEIWTAIRKKKDIDDDKVDRIKRALSPLVMQDDSTTQSKVNLYKNNDKKILVLPEDLLSNVFSTPTVNTTSNQYALCELWDFAGQKEFYATHQAFLTSSAVYLVVANMEDDIRKQGLGQCFADYQNIGEYVDFWFDSIHCHRTTDKRARNMHLDPPIILVFTGKDKYDKEADLKKRKKELNDQLDQVLGLQSKYHHLHKKWYLSNLTDTDEEFVKLQHAISETARKMDNWGNAFPLKWILLEHLIEINKNDGKNIINLNDMSKLAKHHDINILEKDELLLFLRFQHNVGNIIFFENIPDLIILKPQWLADAFRCLVSDRIDDSSLHYLEDWTLFTRQGKISESLITKLFETKDGSQFLGQKNNLHKVMEKLDILVKIENSNYYIMPSQMPSSTFEDICREFGILTPKCERTSWLCFKFIFLPPSFFNHISAWFIKEYIPSNVASDSTSVALYRGICVFDIDRSGVTKILVTMSTDTIALQVLSFSEKVRFASTCSDIYSKVTQLIEDIQVRYSVYISFKLHFKCRDGYYLQDTFEFEKLISEKECFCTQHRQMHRSEQIYSPWMNNEIK